MATTVIKHKFSLGDFVYLVTDREQYKRIITAIIICPDDSLLYECCCGRESSKHYEFELSPECDVEMKVIS